MIDGKTIIAIIPARGGSKRVPRKNLANIVGRPMIEYSIESAMRSRYVDEVLVSTDDKEIADVARTCGAKVPFLRPAELATDESNTFDVIEHAINHAKSREGKDYDYVLLLQPTSPLRDAVDVDGAIELLATKGADAVISVCHVEYSPLWTNILPDDMSMEQFIREEVKNKRSQDLGEYYRLNGAIYICNITRFLAEKTFFIKDNIFAYVMSQENSVDVDTSLDLKMCEFLMRDKS